MGREVSALLAALDMAQQAREEERRRIMALIGWSAFAIEMEDRANSPISYWPAAISCLAVEPLLAVLRDLGAE